MSKLNKNRNEKDNAAAVHHQCQFRSLALSQMPAISRSRPLPASYLWSHPLVLFLSPPLPIFTITVSRR